MKEKKRENAYLSRKVYEIENANYKQKSEWHEKGVTTFKLAEDVYMNKSDDHMVWYLWKRFPDQAREFCKIVPAFFLYPDTIEKILKAQGWVCI